MSVLDTGRILEQSSNAGGNPEEERKLEEVRQELESLAKQKGVTLNFDGVENLGLFAKSQIFGGTLDFLKGLTDEQVAILKTKEPLVARRSYPTMVRNGLFGKQEVSGIPKAFSLDDAMRALQKYGSGPSRSKETARALRFSSSKAEELAPTDQARNDSSLGNLATSVDNPPTEDTTEMQDVVEPPTAPPAPPQEPPLPPKTGGGGEDEDPRGEKIETVKPGHNEIMSGMNVFFTGYALSEIAKSGDTKALENLRMEIEGGLSDLEQGELEALISHDVSVSVKGPDVLSPVYHEDSGILDLGIKATGPEITKAGRDIISSWTTNGVAEVEFENTATAGPVGFLDKARASLENSKETYKGIDIEVSYEAMDVPPEILNPLRTNIRTTLDRLSGGELDALVSNHVSIMISKPGTEFALDPSYKLNIPADSSPEAFRNFLDTRALPLLMPVGPATNSSAVIEEKTVESDPAPLKPEDPQEPVDTAEIPRVEIDEDLNSGEFVQVVEEAKNGEESWRFDLENKRRAYAEAQIKFSRSEGEEEENANVQTLKNAEVEYDNARNSAEAVIRESLKDKPEAEVESILVEELLEKENREFLEAQRKAQGEILKDKTKEALMTVIKTKGVQWYLRLPKMKRMICNFAVGGLAGLVAGSITAPTAAAGYLAWRGARVFGGGALGTAVGEAAGEKWSIEDLNKKEAEEISVLQNDPNLSKEEKFYGFGEIKERYRRERLKYSAIRTGASVVAGAGAGLYMGLMENIANGSGIPETTGSRMGNIQDRLPRRSGFQPADQTLKPSPVVDRMASRSIPAPDVPVAEVSEVSAEPDLPARADIAQDVVETQDSASNEIFSDPSVLKHVPQKGDTLWNEVKETLKHNDRFKNFSGTPEEIEAKQTFVVNKYINFIAQDPNSMTYGVGKGGDIFVGREVDLTKAFEDTKKFDSIMKDAENLSSANAKVIVNYNRQIEQYVTKNPEIKLTPDIVSEILAEKPETPIVPKVEPSPQIPVTEDPIREEAVKTLDKIESTPLPAKTGVETIDSWRQRIAILKQKAEDLELRKNMISPAALRQESLGIQMEVNELLDKIQKGVPDESKDMASISGVTPENVAKGLALGAVAGVGAQMVKNKLDVAAREEIRVAKERLGVLEGGSGFVAPKPEIRTMASDIEGAKSKLTPLQIEAALRNGLDVAFGKPAGILSRKKAGIDSPEWKFIGRLPFSQIEKFYGEDPAKSGLSPQSVAELERTDKYVKFVRDMMRHLDKDQNGGISFSFHPEDTVEQVMRKIIEKLSDEPEVRVQG